MGTYVSCAGVKNTTPATIDSDAVLRDFNLSPPTAAVIGAGVAGVHVAYELAQLGFDVTVFEQSSSIASGGGTRFALPFTGVGLLQPSFVEMNIFNEILKGCISAACPAIIGPGNWFNTLFRPELYQWVMARRRSYFSGEEVMRCTDNLSRLSLSIVSRLVKKHPSLQKHILAENVPVHMVVQTSTKGNAGQNFYLAPARTAHPSPIVIDPVGWTQALASICARQYGVKFALSERWEGANTYLKYNTETTRSIRTSVENLGAERETREYRQYLFDIVVLATGAQTGVVTMQSSKLPIIPLSGWAVTLSHLTEPLSSSLKHLFFEKDTGHGVSLTQLSGPCSFYGYHFPCSRRHNRCDALVNSRLDDLEGGKNSSPANSGNGMQTVDPNVQYHLTGLLSLNNIFQAHYPTAVSLALSRLEAYLRVKCSVEAPLTQSQALTHEKETNCIKTNCSSLSQRLKVDEYIRGFTPDAVPLIDQSGGAFNMFVCSGFGDHAMDFAPGAAKILGNLIQNQAEYLLEEDQAQLKLRGLVDPVLPLSRRAQLEKEMQLLFNGILSTERDTGWWSWLNSMTWWNRKQTRAAEDRRGVELVHFNINPFSTDRYACLGKKSFLMKTHHSPMAYITAMEEKLVRKMEPAFEYLTKWAIDLARKENTPDFVRTLVFNLLYDYELDTLGQEFVPKFEEARSQLIRERELEQTHVIKIIEQSKAKNAEIERRARGTLKKSPAFTAENCQLCVPEWG